MYMLLIKVNQKQKYQELTLNFNFQSAVVTFCINKFNTQQFYVLPTQCICVFCLDLRTNSDYFPIQH